MGLPLSNRSYGFAALRGQFVAATQPLATLPSDWQTQEQDGWYLYRHPTTRLVSLVIEGETVGWLIGSPWEGSRIIRGELAAATEGELLERLDGLGGPMAAIVPGRFVRHDAMGQQSLVYSSELRAVATNPLLLKEACGGELDEELVHLMNIPEEDRWYPFGVTPVVGVERLLPNHRLDLQTWKAIRYWPLPADLGAAPVTVEEAVDIVRKCLRDAIDALAAEDPLQIGITAGYDSRLILACARRHAPTMVSATNIMHPTTRKIDHHVARRVARIAGMPHEIRKPQEATAEERADFVDQTGLSAAGARYDHIALMNAFGTERVLLYGHGSDVIRGTYHKRLKHQGISLDRYRDPGVMLALLKCPRHSSFVEAHGRWVAGLPSCSGAAAWSLAYQELREGCWAAVLAQSGVYRPVWPFAHRDLLRLMLCLPLEAQHSMAVFRGVIAAEWPDLLRVPFNDAVGLARVRRNAGEILGRVRSKLGALRRRFSPSIT